LPASRSPFSSPSRETHWCPWTSFLLKGTEMDIASHKGLLYRAVTVGLLGLILAVCAPKAGAQGAAPEPAPPLFPGGALVSYNSVFVTRGMFVAPPGSIPNTARPTFSHEGLFNFTWGFHPDFDLTVLVP